MMISVLQECILILSVYDVWLKATAAGEGGWDALTNKQEAASRLGWQWADERSSWVDCFRAQSQQQRRVWQAEGRKGWGWFATL